MSNYNHRENQKSPLKRFLFILRVAFLILYFVMGIAVIFWKEFPIEMDFGYRLAFGILLIAYSFFRFYSVLRGKE